MSEKNFLGINLSCLFNFDQFKGHFGAVSGYFGVGVGSENYFGVYLYILSTIVFLSNPKFFAFSILTNSRSFRAFWGYIWLF